jgi:predicted nucleotidyltransferase
MMDQLIAKIKSHPVKSYLQSNHVHHVRLVGSFARWEEHQDSDVDLLVQFDNHPSLNRAIYTIPEMLSARLWKRIDIFDIDYLNKHIASWILADKIAIW